ncbi:MAG: DUF3226 domain-containing protein [Myxococcota bacterium]
MSAGRPNRTSTRNRLYVEGADDFHVVCALVRKSGISWEASDERIPFAPFTNGDANAIKQAVVAAKNQTPRVGLVIDGDAAPKNRWHELRRRFTSIGLELPEIYTDNGVVISFAGVCRLGIWMMPHGGQPGAVEALVASLVPESPLEQHARVATEQARSVGAEFADKDLQKARLRAWLSWQKAPGAPYGRAIDAGFLHSSSPMTVALVAWFRRLFLD